ncbi:MAG TPA: Spy/CpxP family protein refolding chaperone [Bdellovibrionales bacterium]|nr:Spy/CpxP family protein refolding chaperone [Bdellovibrionales bacterium]
MKRYGSRRFKFLSGLFAVVAAIGLLGGCKRGCDAEGRADKVVGKLSRKLDLTEAQRAKLEDVKRAFLSARSKARAGRQQDLDTVKGLILSEKIEAAPVRALVDKHKQVFDENFNDVFAKAADFHASLTPEQKKEAVALIEKFSSHWKQ